MRDAYEDIFKDKERVMVVMAHPDDLEVFAGGTVARLAAQGNVVRSVKLTAGNMGSRDTDISAKELAETRMQEDKQAMETLGVLPEHTICLQFEDGTVDNSLQVIEAITLQIRQFKPQLIITSNPEHAIITRPNGETRVNHHDHRNAALSTVDAVYPFSRDKLFFPEHLEENGASSHVCMEFLFAEYYGHEQLVAINVQQYMDKRIQALACHASQMDAEKVQRVTDTFTKHKGIEARFELFRHVVIN